MAFPKLTKQEALRLECARITHDATTARSLYNFIIEPPEPKKSIKKQPRKKRIN